MAFGSYDHSAPQRRAAGTYVPNPSIARLRDDFKAYASPLGFTADQWRFTEAFFTGCNVCLSGRAGTGKSYVLKALFEYLTKQRVSVGRTATTGVSAFGIGGQTIHSWAGLGLADEHAEAIIASIQKRGKVKARIRAAKVLFIDEVSMAKADLMDKLDAVLRYYRDSGDPFGGVQVVLCGDFLQLAPVFKGDETQAFAFHSEVWDAASVRTIVLQKVVRQQGDNTLLTVLNDVRVGDTSSLHLLDARVGATWPDNEIEPVRIFCKNVDVDGFNRERMARLTTAAKTYTARDTGEPYHTDSFNKNCPAPQVLELKVGAQVLLVANLDVASGYVNGSVGVVKAFGPNGVTVRFTQGTTVVDHNDWSIKEQAVGLDGKIIYRTVATRRQIPLKVCYGLTVHRCLSPDAVVHLTTGSKSLSRVRNDRAYGVYGGGHAITKRHHMPKHDCLRITTRSGRQIICGPQHRLAVAAGISQYTFVEAISLKTGDRLLSKVGFPTNEASDLSADLCWWLGATVGDGSYNDPVDYRVELANIPIECGDTWHQLSESLFGVKVTKRRLWCDKTGRWSRACGYYFHRKAVRERLVKLGLDYAKTTGKRVPHAIFNASRQSIAAFVCGFIDTDGHLSKREINISSIGRELLAGTQTLLTILGYRSTLMWDIHYWKLRMYRAEAQRWLGEFGGLLRAGLKYRNREALLAINQQVTKVQRNDFPILPHETSEILRELLIRYGVTYGMAQRLRLPPTVPRTLSTHLRHKAAFFNRYTILDLARYLPDLAALGPTCATALRYAQEGYYGDSVVAVELTEPRDLADITVADSHQYFADGVLHHNCQGMTLDRAIIDMTEAFTTGQVYTSLSRVRDLESLSLASPIPHSAIRVNPECVEFYESAERAEKVF